MGKKFKTTETLEQYLSRGGKISLLPKIKVEEPMEAIKQTTVGPANLMTLEEADLFYGEKKKNQKPKKAKASTKIDLNALPPSLRSKFISKLKEEVDGEGYEEELEELEEESDEDDIYS